MTRLFTTSVALLVAGSVLIAWTVLPPASYTFESTPNMMNVEGGSTLHDWTCPINTLNGSLQIDTAEADGELPVGKVTQVQVNVPVDAITCEKETMNEKLREALRMKENPQVQFTLTNASLSALADSSESWFAVDATGELSMAGNRRQIELPVKAQQLSNGNFRFVGSHTIRLSDYDVDRPSAMFGAIKTSKEVTVNFDVTATPTASAE